MQMVKVENNKLLCVASCVISIRVVLNARPCELASGCFSDRVCRAHFFIMRQHYCMQPPGILVEVCQAALNDPIRQVWTRVCSLLFVWKYTLKRNAPLCGSRRPISSSVPRLRSQFVDIWSRRLCFFLPILQVVHHCTCRLQTTPTLR